MPAQNALPEPVRIKTCAVERSISSSAAISSATNWKLTALRFSGRFSVMVATAPSYASWIVVYSMV